MVVVKTKLREIRSSKMKKILLPILSSLALTDVALAQSAVTVPVGFNSITCLPHSDTICSVPFNSEVAFQGVLLHSPSINAGAVTLTPSTAVSWIPNQFQTIYFVRFISGAMSGMYFQVSANAAGTLTVDPAGEDLSTVLAGDQFKLCKFWTLGTLFPPATQTTIVPSTGNIGPQRRTEILFPNTSGAGINLSASIICFLVDNHEWRDASGFTNADNYILYPDTYFIVRHAKAAISNPTTYTITGSVELKDVSAILATRLAGQQDNFVSHGRPVDIKLKDLGLSSSAFIDSASNLGPARRDQLLIFSNDVAKINRSASAIYFRVGGQWRNASGFVAADDDIMPAGSGFIIRKYAAAGSGVIWTNNPF